MRIGFDDGSFVLRSPEPLRPYARCIGEWLEQWAKQTPDALFLAEREASGEWRKLSYAQVRRTVGAIAQSLLGRLPGGNIVAGLAVLPAHRLQLTRLRMPRQHRFQAGN